MDPGRAVIAWAALSCAACADYGSTDIDARLDAGAKTRDASGADLVVTDARAADAPVADVVGDVAAADAPAADAPSADVVTVDVGPPRPLRVAQRDVVVTPVGSVRQPSVAYHAGADVFVTAYTWVIPDAPTPRFRTEVRALTVGADGALAVGAALMVDGDTVRHDAGDPAIAAPDAPTTPALAVWIDDRADPGGRTAIEVYGRFVRPSGGASPTVSPVGDAFVISQRPGANEYLPAVAWDPVAGVFVVVWADDRERGVRHEDARVVYARTVAPDGRLGPEQRLGDDGLFQTFPSAASCGDGRVLVGWSDYRRDGAAYVSQARGRVVDARTAAPMGDIRLWGDARDRPQDLVPVQCAPGRDGWLVAWGVGGPPSIRQQRLARLNADGSLRGAPSSPTRQPDGARAVSLATASTGQLVATFLAQDSTYGYIAAFAPDDVDHATATTLTPTAPRLGTFWASVAASSRRPEAIAVMTLDYDRLHATTLVP